MPHILLILVYTILLIIVFTGLGMFYFQNDNWLISDLFSFMVLLCVFTILLVIIDNPNFWSRLRSLKVGASQIEIELEKAQDTLKDEKRETQPEEVKTELQEIKVQSYTKTPLDTFMLIENRIQEKLSLLFRIWKTPHGSYVPMIDHLHENGHLDETTYSLVKRLRPIRNEIVHRRQRVTMNQLDNAIDLGYEVLSRLTRVYVQDLEREKAIEFIQNSNDKYPNLEYVQGNSKSGKPDLVGIYYMVRPTGRSRTELTN